METLEDDIQPGLQRQSHHDFGPRYDRGDTNLPRNSSPGGQEGTDFPAGARYTESDYRYHWSNSHVRKIFTPALTF